MLLSIILPVYNVEPYLRECIDSIYRMGASSFEIIAVNDGSTDNSLLILEEYEHKYNNLKIISQHNNGLSAARNVGLQNCQGEYVYFFDSDDIMAECPIPLTKIARKKDADIIVFNAEVFNEEISKGLILNNDYKEYYLIAETKQSVDGVSVRLLNGIEYLDINKNRNGYSPVVWRRIYNRNFLISNNLTFYPGLVPAEDDLFYFETMFLKPRVVYFENVIVFHRLRATSIMSNLKREKSYQSFNYILNKLFEMKKKRQQEHEMLFNWVINIFVRRTFSQKPSFKEARRLLRLVTSNEVKIEFKTLIKLLVNLLRIKLS
jgi:glycosyltransferase involved in cell wall biosynthesis